MKGLLLICAGLLLLGMISLPMGYYTFLRITVTCGSIYIILTEKNNGINFWIITFGLMAILFNPIFPIHLYDKSVWMVIDFICAILFIAKSYSLK